MEKLTAQTFQDICGKLPYVDFVDHKQRLCYWEKYAYEVLALLEEDKNIGLVGETGIGKTIISILISLFFRKVLILSPTRILTVQHKELYDCITGKISSEVINGTKPAKQRNWDNDTHFVSATPQTFLKDFEKDMINIKKFELIIFDEFDMASGEYSYVPIARLCKEHKILNLGLSASPGDSILKIENKKLIYHFDKLIPLKIPIPNKVYKKVSIELNGVIKTATDLLNTQMVVCLKELDKFVPSSSKLFLDNGNYLSESNLKEIKKVINSLRNEPMRRASSTIAEYYKLAFCSRILAGESYHTFLDYVKKLKRDGSSSKGSVNYSCKRIINNENFRKLANEIYRESIKNLHPKIVSLILEIRRIPNDQGIIFVENKKTAKYIEGVLNANDIKSSVLTGGSNKSKKNTNSILDSFMKREVRFLVVTSVIERGWSVPYIETVIHYTLPMTGISLIQRNGRAGRFKPGNVIYLVVDNKYENTLYMVANKKCNLMKKIVYEQKIAPPSKRIKKGLSLQYRLNL